MKSILIILTQANITQQYMVESLSASLVLATFGSEIQFLFKDHALSLLKNDLIFDKSLFNFKHASNIVDSLEFFDIEKIYIEEKDRASDFVRKTEHSLEFIEFSGEFIQKFDHVLYW